MGMSQHVLLECMTPRGIHMIILQASHIEKQFDGTPVLRDATLVVQSRDRVALVGSNGAGKSTLLRLAAGIWKPSSGAVMINQHYLTTLSMKERARNIAYLPQQISEDCPYTVRDFVEMGRYAYRSGFLGLSPKGRFSVQDAIVQMGLQKHADTPLFRLSGGERQRAGIARCLAQESRILLLDEPISNLDIYYQIDILERLKQFANDGFLVILSIHHLEFAARYCTNLLLLNQGAVHAVGKVDDVLSEQAVEQVFAVHAKRYFDPHGEYLRFSYELHETAPFEAEVLHEL